MKDEEPAGAGGLGDEISRMLHARALRHPDQTDPVGITRKALRTAARSRRRTAVGATTALALSGAAVFGVAATHTFTAGKGTDGVSAAVGDYNAAAVCAVSAKVPVDIPRGATTTQIANALFSAGVIKSAQAYVKAADQNPASAGVSAGTYAVCPRISGANAVLELLKKSNLSDASQIIVTSHEWAKDVIDDLVAKRKWKQADFDAAISDNTIGLPEWSRNSLSGQFTVEGMLEPGTYVITASDTPQTILAQMVANRMAFLKSVDFEVRARDLTCGTGKCTPEDVLKVASIAEGEVTDPADGSRVAKVVYARLKADDYLAIDSTSLYVIGHLPNGELPTAAQIQDPKNPYSTYAHRGLPPTPIYVTSDDMIKAALAPAQDADYYYCVTPTGTEFFTKSQESEFNKACAVAR